MARKRSTTRSLASYANQYHNARLSGNSRRVNTGYRRDRRKSADEREIDRMFNRNLTHSFYKEIDNSPVNLTGYDWVYK